MSETILAQRLAEVEEVIKNALDNYAHGRRVFALQQLEALVGHTSDASEIARGNDEFYTNRCLKRKGHR